MTHKPAGHRAQSQIDGARREFPAFEVNAVTQHNSSVEWEPRLRAIPLDELIDGMPIAALSIGRRKAIHNCGCRLIQIWQQLDSDERPFAIIVNTARSEFLLVGANGIPRVAVDSPGPPHVAVARKDEGRYPAGDWIPGRRLNGNEVDEGLPGADIGMLNVKLLRFE